MPYNEKLPEWQNPGQEPPSSRKINGWNPQDRPPAEWMNWFFNRTYAVLKEMKDRGISIDEFQEVTNLRIDSDGNFHETVEDRLNAEQNKFDNKVTKQKYYVSMKEFPRYDIEISDSPRWQRAIDSLTEGGIIIPEIVEYILNVTVIIKENIGIIGQGYGRFKIGTSFRYVGTGPAFTFTNRTAGILLSNFKIYAKSGDSSFQNFTGIDINFAELVTIENITIENANIGIDCTGSLGSIYLLNIINPFIFNCLNEGIYIRSGTWKNGIYIKVGDISDNNIGIRCATGNGNTIDGDAAEIGRNKTGGILLEGGVWTVKGALWIEGSPYGIQSTGGHHHILGDVYCISPINKMGGSLIVDSQAHVQPVQASAIKKGLVFWYSFEEGSGSVTYDRSSGHKGTFSSVPTWNSDVSVFGTTIESISSNSLNLPLDKIDWAKDWTILTLAKGPNTSNFFFLLGSDNIQQLFFRPYQNGTQLWDNTGFKKNFQSFPNRDATLNMNWHIIAYDSANKKLNVYSQSGKLQDSFTYTVSPAMSSPRLVNLASVGIVLDEFIVYNRILNDSEIRAITQMTLPPDVKGDDFMILKSPDGSRWRLTLDNNGAWTSVKI